MLESLDFPVLYLLYSRWKTTWMRQYGQPKPVKPWPAPLCKAGTFWTFSHWASQPSETVALPPHPIPLSSMPLSVFLPGLTTIYNDFVYLLFLSYSPSECKFHKADTMTIFVRVFVLPVVCWTNNNCLCRWHLSFRTIQEHQWPAGWPH